MVPAFLYNWDTQNTNADWALVAEGDHLYQRQFTSEPFYHEIGAK